MTTRLTCHASCDMTFNLGNICMKPRWLSRYRTVGFLRVHTHTYVQYNLCKCKPRYWCDWQLTKIFERRYNCGFRVHCQVVGREGGRHKRRKARPLQSLPTSAVGMRSQSTPEDVLSPDIGPHLWHINSILMPCRIRRRLLREREKTYSGYTKSVIF